MVVVQSSFRTLHRSSRDASSHCSGLMNDQGDIHLDRLRLGRVSANDNFKLIISILASLAQKERERISARTKEALAGTKAHGGKSSVAERG